MPVLSNEPAVMNLTVLPGGVSNPDAGAVHFDVLHGAANEVIGRLRDLGLEQRGSIVLENVDTSISAVADRVAGRRRRSQQFALVWAEIKALSSTRWNGSLSERSWPATAGLSPWTKSTTAPPC